MAKKASLMEVQWCKTVVFHQEGSLERQISKAEKCSKTPVHNALVKCESS